MVPPWPHVRAECDRLPHRWPRNKAVAEQWPRRHNADMDDRLSADVVDYYSSRYQEDQRLQARPQARLEWLRTLQLLGELLPDQGARVLDVGGGTGHYARALVNAGHQVRLLDLVPSHVAQARAGQPAIVADVADARTLPEASATYDATILLGPLYHLPDRLDRLAALREAVRVTRPSGHVVAAAISRFAWPMDCVVAASANPSWTDDARTLLTDGANDNSRSFTHAYFHRFDELLGECQEAGLHDVVVHGLEGPAWIAAEAAAGTPTAETIFTRALTLAQIYSSEQSLVATSAHLLAIGVVPSPLQGLPERRISDAGWRSVA